MSCLIDGCQSKSITKFKTFITLPGSTPKVKVSLEVCEDHRAKFFAGTDPGSKIVGVQRPPPTESEAVNLVREMMQALMPDPRKALGDLYPRVLRFLKRMS